MVVVGPARAGPFRRQQRFQTPPLRIRQCITFHIPNMGALTTPPHPLQTRPNIG